MKKIILSALLVSVLFIGVHSSHAFVGDFAPLHLVTEDAQVLKAGRENTFRFALMDKSEKKLTPNDLKEVHTKKFHMLIVSETLTDYIHAHPVFDEKTQTYAVTFAPKEKSFYKAWADVTLTQSGEQFFLPIIFKGTQNCIPAPCATDCIDRTENLASTEAGVTAEMKISSSVEEDGLSGNYMAEIALKDKDGKPVTDLEPVMGAYAHLVGFTADLKNVIHAHPMGEEPLKETDRGGPALSFHIETESAGYNKFYLQIKRNGQDIYLPFGITTK